MTSAFSTCVTGFCYAKGEIDFRWSRWTSLRCVAKLLTNLRLTCVVSDSLDSCHVLHCWMANALSYMRCCAVVHGIHRLLVHSQPFCLAVRFYCRQQAAHTGPLLSFIKTRCVALDPWCAAMCSVTLLLCVIDDYGLTPVLRHAAGRSWLSVPGSERR